MIDISKINEERLKDAKAIHAASKKNMENPVISNKQKFKFRSLVYIKPIYHITKLHFDCDIISKVEGAYSQLYGGNDFSEYSLEIAAWYSENELMAADNLSISECRDKCKSYFGESYGTMMEKREESINNHPLKCVQDSIDKAILEAIDHAARP